MNKNRTIVLRLDSRFVEDLDAAWRRLRREEEQREVPFTSRTDFIERVLSGVCSMSEVSWVFFSATWVKPKQ
jgi:hypothetical protein